MTKVKITLEERLTKEFNALIYKLINRLAAKHRNDAKVELLRNRFSLAVSVNATAVMILAGSHLSKYSDQICNRDEEYFTKTNLLEAEEIKDPLAIDLIQMIMADLQVASEREKDEVYNDLLELMEKYLEYSAIS